MKPHKLIEESDNGEGTTAKKKKKKNKKKKNKQGAEDGAEGSQSIQGRKFDPSNMDND